MNTRHYTDYTSEDLPSAKHWVRMFCAPMPDGACGLILFQQHYENVSEYFDHATEANIGLVCAGSMEHATKMINQGQSHLGYNPAVIRRLARLLSNGDLSEQIGNTLALRGLERAVSYHITDDTGKKLTMFERAGWTSETRQGKTVYLLEL